MTGIRGVDPTHRTYVSYIDKSRDLYLARGYSNPYRWAHFEDVPFAPLARPLAQSAVTIVTTAMPAPDNADDVPESRKVFSISGAPPPAKLSTEGLFWDRGATHTDDLDSFFPIHRLGEFVREGRVGRVAARLHCVPTEYSQRSTIERDAPEIVRRCREDGAAAALLVPL
ncbi:hypothetical protein L6Q96_16385 [Candidatus Binatia bacterium]|nr:hypothetical protein [Candidatus Binatia bacterium]